MELEVNADGQIWLSCALLALALWLHYRSALGRVRSALMLAVAMLSLILYALYFVSDYFTAEGINEAVIYHLRYGLSDAGFLEYAGLAILSVASLALLFGLLVKLEMKKSRSAIRLMARNTGYHGIAAVLCAACSLTINPAAANVYDLLSGTVQTAPGFAAAGGSAEAALGTEFERYYEQPLLERTGMRPRNLVFIYAESLERTYFDQKTFPGLLPRLSELERSATTFTDIAQVTGTGWTIAGMVASQCGIPLFTPSHGNSMSGLEKFLPAATCLGDLLKGEGYHLAYLGGARKRFAGKASFYETHHFDEVAGKEELLPGLKDPAYVNAWGLYDDALFDLAFERYLDMASSHERYALFLLTLDTHHPDGHLSRSCEAERYRDGANPVLNAVSCSDRLLSRFIGRIRHSRFGKDTVIVLVSDHLAMRNSAHDLLERNKRSNLFMILPPNAERGRQVDATGSALDIAPTIAPYIGYRLRLGLGSDLMSKGRQEARVEGIQDRLHTWSEPLSRFWGFPKVRDAIEVDAANRIARIDGWPVTIPSLIEIDGEMQTVIKFPGFETSMELVRRTPPDRAFLLLTDCSARNPHMKYGMTCLFAGQGDRFHAQLILRDRIRIPAADIWGMAGGHP